MGLWPQHLYASMSTYRIETQAAIPGTYTDITATPQPPGGPHHGIRKEAAAHCSSAHTPSPLPPTFSMNWQNAKTSALRLCQMEDEIAGVCSAIGASYGGHLAVTNNFRPGSRPSRAKASDLAVMASALPLVVIDVQRGGPSTGLPTKTEQTDLMQALWPQRRKARFMRLPPQVSTDRFTMAFGGRS